MEKVYVYCYSKYLGTSLWNTIDFESAFVPLKSPNGLWNSIDSLESPKSANLWKNKIKTSNILIASNFLDHMKVSAYFMLLFTFFFVSSNYSKHANGYCFIELHLFALFFTSDHQLSARCSISVLNFLFFSIFQILWNIYL